MISSRGQEAAPFELLVGVVMMAFVLAIGFVVITGSQKAQCEQQAKDLVERLRSEFESLFKNESSKHLSVESPSCFSEKSSIEIRGQKDREVCALFCSGSNERCTLIMFSTETFSEIGCLRVPQDILFKEPENCENTPQDSVPFNFEPVSFGYNKDLNAGNYFFSKKVVFSTSQPEICSYKQDLSG